MRAYGTDHGTDGPSNLVQSSNRHVYVREKKRGQMGARSMHVIRGECWTPPIGRLDDWPARR